MSGLAFYFYVPVLRWLPRASKLCAYVRSGNKFKSVTVKRIFPEYKINKTNMNYQYLGF